MKRIILFPAAYALLLVLCFCACNEDFPETNEPDLDTAAVSPEAEIRELREDLDALNGDYADLEQRYDDLTASYQGILKNYYNILYSFSPTNSDCWDTVKYAPEDTSCYALFTTESAVLKTISNRLVHVFFSIYKQDAKSGEDVSWSAVYSPSLDTSVDALVWIPTADLLDYAPEMEQTLTYPLKVRCKNDYGVGCDEIVEVSYEKGRIMVLLAGGQGFYVDRDALIYPSVKNGEIVWE